MHYLRLAWFCEGEGKAPKVLGKVNPFLILYPYQLVNTHRQSNFFSNYFCFFSYNTHICTDMKIFYHDSTLKWKYWAFANHGGFSKFISSTVTKATTLHCWWLKGRVCLFTDSGAEKRNSPLPFWCSYNIKRMSTQTSRPTKEIVRRRDRERRHS